MLSQLLTAQVGIGTTTPHNSAALDIESSTKGLLPPRMTMSQMESINTPATALIVYCLDCSPEGLRVYNGSTWSSIGEPSIATDCNANGFEGTYINNLPLNNHRFSVTIQNSSFNVVGFNFTSSDLSLSGTGASGITVSNVVPASATLNSEESVVVSYTLSGTTNSSGPLTANWSKLHLACQSSTNVTQVQLPDNAIFDRAFGDGIHDFVYLPITAADGNTWLNHNLGAHYTDIHHASFNPTQQATSSTDHLAYGSLYQWGRSSDGHELIQYTNATTGTRVNGITDVNAASDSPDHNLFITELVNPNDWRIPQNNNLWQGEAGINNPCPQGYRLPRRAEISTLFSAEGITDATTGANSSLAYSLAGLNSVTGELIFQGNTGNYWTSERLTPDSVFSADYTISNGLNSLPRGMGLAVRCIQD